MSDMQFMISVKDGNHSHGEIIDLEDNASDEDLARCTELAHEMLSVLERAVHRRQRKRAERDAQREGRGR